MRVGLLHAVRWIETGRIVGVDCNSSRLAIEARLGRPTSFGMSNDRVVKYDELEVCYASREPSALPLYLQHDFNRRTLARWNDELRFIRSASRPLADALCRVDLDRVADELRARSVRVLFDGESPRTLLIDVGEGVTIGLDFTTSAAPPTSGAIGSQPRDGFEHRWRNIEYPSARKRR